MVGPGAPSGLHAIAPNAWPLLGCLEVTAIGLTAAGLGEGLPPPRPRSGARSPSSLAGRTAARAELSTERAAR
jgi:hypothetical protein